MGRFADLCGDVAASLEEGVEGLALPPDAWDRFRGSWDEEDIEDAIALVQESLLQSELIDAADSLSARMVELLGSFGNDEGFQKAAAGQATLTVDDLGQLARRVGRLEDVLETFRDVQPPENPEFERLRVRLADHGIEAEMALGRESGGIDDAE
jgi:uncharacterized protein with von Willebrand factor type A (vWA) domain